jgi:hypothetical protein
MSQQRQVTLLHKNIPLLHKNGMRFGINMQSPIRGEEKDRITCAAWSILR